MYLITAILLTTQTTQTTKNFKYLFNHNNFFSSSHWQISEHPFKPLHLTTLTNTFSPHLKYSWPDQLPHLILTEHKGRQGSGSNSTFRTQEGQAGVSFTDSLVQKLVYIVFVCVGVGTLHIQIKDETNDWEKWKGILRLMQ